MDGVIQLKWLRNGDHLLAHPLVKTKKNGTKVYRTSCRFYTPLVHYTKADKKIIWKKDGSASFEIKNK
ncbi:hypothetical protein ETU09_09570 [Apibacter muscae]|uniref:Uncharacterized protein n=1 Tax=Apibacter muscae TaxID=2509004 RepID=A0A563D9Q9_9FLAO|nr:hypothetical protein [Apibacter muscae]TWP26799.1 hypothetical protein ETU09_09570 [Apibacter muscae]